MNDDNDDIKNRINELEKTVKELDELVQVLCREVDTLFNRFTSFIDKVKLCS